ncbi:flagellar basal body-associated FliL family protein, partial [Alphaproteobacteria bacterium]|nr:flagellar basal body-associated FliL family protein [Alphaproteobacteria bacterium]
EKVFETIYHEFPGTFTTNLSGSRKMLQIGIGVSTQYDDTVMMNVEAHQLALRSVILGVIANYTEEQVKSSDGRDVLAGAIRDTINAKLEFLENFGGIEEVHFTSFVLQ